MAGAAWRPSTTRWRMLESKHTRHHSTPRRTERRGEWMVAWRRQLRRACQRRSNPMSRRKLAGALRRMAGVRQSVSGRCRRPACAAKLTSRSKHVDADRAEVTRRPVSSAWARPTRNSSETSCQTPNELGMATLAALQVQTAVLQDGGLATLLVDLLSAEFLAPSVLLAEPRLASGGALGRTGAAHEHRGALFLSVGVRQC